MELLLQRKYKKTTYTIGNLYIIDEKGNKTFFSNTCEDKDRGMRQGDAYAANKRKKVPNETAIPTGRYRVTLGVQSPKYSKRAAYNWCNGYLPRLINVPCFDGILIHAGNTANDSSGCILVGQNREVGKVLDSMVTLKALYEKLKAAKDYIYITIE